MEHEKAGNFVDEDQLTYYELFASLLEHRTLLLLVIFVSSLVHTLL
jgi:hypothetical protein